MLRHYAQHRNAECHMITTLMLIVALLIVMPECCNVLLFKVSLCRRVSLMLTFVMLTVLMLIIVMRSSTSCNASGVVMNVIMLLHFAEC
jgi:hypothetical protein